MPIINVQPKEMKNGDVVTYYTNTVSVVPEVFVFLKEQERVILRNKGSKSSQYEENMTPKEQYYGQFDLMTGRLVRKGLTQFVEPIKDRVPFKIDGNHDGTRAKEFNDIPPSEQWCKEMGIRYMEDLALLQLSVGFNSYTSFHHHISGSTGKKQNLNKLQDLGSDWWFDIVWGEHTHRTLQGNKPYITLDRKHKKVKVRKQYYINSNSMAGYGGYAKNKGYSPGITGFKVVKLSGKKQDPHITVFDTFRDFVDYYERR